MTNNGRKIK